MTIYLAQILQMTKERQNNDYETYGAISNKVVNYFNHLSIST